MSVIAKPLRAAGPALAALLLATGCTQVYHFQVDALARDDVPVLARSQVYSFVSADGNEGDLRYQEVVGYAREALAERGLEEATPGVEPLVFVELDYGIGSAQTDFEERAVTRRLPPHYEVIPVVVKNKDGGTVVKYSTRLVPGDLYTDWETVAVTRFPKYFEMRAVERIPGGGGPSEQELWSVRVENYSSSSDLRRYLPLMVAASVDFIGNDTGQEVIVHLKEDAEILARVKGEAAPQS